MNNQNTETNATEQKPTKENNKDQEKITQNQNSEDNLNEDSINKLTEENKNLNDKILRLAAELENTRKRSNEELNKAHKYAISNFASELVVITENFFLASDNLPKEEISKSDKIKNFVDAILMTQKELIKILEKNKITRIYPLNEDFDHNLHEAISQILTEDEKDNNKVKKVIQAGYSIGDRLIRPALVAVAKKNS